jgi:hypothetical protein
MQLSARLRVRRAEANPKVKKRAQAGPWPSLFFLAAEIGD